MAMHASLPPSEVMLERHCATILMAHNIEIAKFP